MKNDIYILHSHKECRIIWSFWKEIKLCDSVVFEKNIQYQNDI